MATIEGDASASGLRRSAHRARRSGGAAIHRPVRQRQQQATPTPAGAVGLARPVGPRSRPMPDARLPKAVHVFQTPVNSVDAVGTTVELDDRLLAACEVSSRLLDQVVGRCLAAQFTTTSRIDRVGLAQATPRAPQSGLSGEPVPTSLLMFARGASKRVISEPGPSSRSAALGSYRRRQVRRP